MKKLTLLIFCFLVLIKVSYSNELNPYSNDNLDLIKQQREKIKSAKIIEKNTYRYSTNYNEKDIDSVKVEKWLIIKEYFNDNGQLIKYQSYEGDVGPIFTIQYTYNEEGLLLSILELDNFNTIIQKKDISYDPFSRISKIAITGFNSKPIETIYYEYNKERSICIETNKDSSNKLSGYRVHLYDKPFNKIIKTTIFNKENELDGTIVFNFTDNGIFSREVYSKDINVPFNIKYQNVFDDKGQLKEINNLTYPDNLVVSVKHTYNNFGLIDNTTMYGNDGAIITKLGFVYFNK